MRKLPDLIRDNDETMCQYIYIIPSVSLCWHDTDTSAAVAKLFNFMSIMLKISHKYITECEQTDNNTDLWIH